MLLDLLFRLSPTILPIVLTVTTWREYRQAAEPSSRALFGLIALVLVSILSILGCFLYLINPIRFRYNPFLSVWMLAYCINWLTAPKYTLNPNRFRTGIAIGGCVFVLVGFVLETVNMYAPS